MIESTIGASAPTHNYREAEDEDGYDAFARGVDRRLRDAAAAGPLLRGEVAGDLFRRYLDAIPTARRQHYNCNHCKNFIRRYGDAVVVDDHGLVRSAVWPAPEDLDGPFRDVARDLHAAIGKAGRVVGALIAGPDTIDIHGPAWGRPASEQLLGAGRSIVWRHLHARGVPFWAGLSGSDGAREAEIRADHGTLMRALDEYPAALVARAHALLSTGALPRAEKAVAHAAWLHGLRHGRPPSSSLRLSNRIWAAVAAAPAGWAHVRTSILGTLLDDLAAGKSGDDVRRAWGAKLDPLAYQRPKAAPTDGQLDAAEAMVARLGLAPSLRRRFARMSDVPPAARLWSAPPRDLAPGADVHTPSVFGHLRPRRAAETTTAPAQTMSWTVFARDVLPRAVRLRVIVPSMSGSFFALVTAADAAAPPILQWDAPDARNPVSWYLYGRPSSPAHWNLGPAQGDVGVDVDAVLRQPNRWCPRPTEHHGDGAYLVLRGARDLGTAGRSGVGLFPEILRSDLHGIRAALEAYSASARLPDDPKAIAGICLQAGKSNPIQVLADLPAGVVAPVTVDRWE